MKRTADRPLASGRWPLSVGILGGLAAVALGARLAGAAHQPAHRLACAAHGLHLRRHLHAAQARHQHGHLYRRISRRHGAHARLDRGSRPHRVARRRALRHPLRLAVSAFHVDRMALPRRLRPRRHSHVARRPARRMVDRRRSALLRRAHDSRQPGALVAGRHRRSLRRSSPPRSASSTSPTPFVSPAFCAPRPKTKAASWPAICSR